MPIFRNTLGSQSSLHADLANKGATLVRTRGYVAHIVPMLHKMHLSISIMEGARRAPAAFNTTMHPANVAVSLFWSPNPS